MLVIWNTVHFYMFCFISCFSSSLCGGSIIHVNLSIYLSIYRLPIHPSIYHLSTYLSTYLHLFTFYLTKTLTCHQTSALRRKTNWEMSPLPISSIMAYRHPHHPLLHTPVGKYLISLSPTLFTLLLHKWAHAGICPYFPWYIVFRTRSNIPQYS